MVRLPVKLQFSEYEKGEFDEPVVMSCDEAFQAVVDFPWHLETFRLHNITAPSITIEHTEGAFLKIGRAFDDSFLVYYCTKNGRLYSRGYDTIEEMQECIKQFFDYTLDINSFNRNFWIFSALKHFKTKDFIYKLRLRKMLSRLTFVIIMFMIFMPAILISLTSENVPVFFALFSLLMICILIIPSLILFINYFHYSSNKTLILSRGKNIFYCGKLDEVKEYNKEDITSIIKYYVGNHRNPWNEYAYVKIILKTNEAIIIPNLLLDELYVTEKLRLPSITSYKEKIFPFIRSKKSNASKPCTTPYT